MTDDRAPIGLECWTIQSYICIHSQDPFLVASNFEQSMTVKKSSLPLSSSCDLKSRCLCFWGLANKSAVIYVFTKLTVFDHGKPHVRLRLYPARYADLQLLLATTSKVCSRESGICLKNMAMCTWDTADCIGIRMRVADLARS